MILIAPLNVIIEQELSKLGLAACRVARNDQSVAFSTKTKYIIGHPEDVMHHGEEIGSFARTFDTSYVVIDEAQCV